MPVFDPGVPWLRGSAILTNGSTTVTTDGVITLNEILEGDRLYVFDGGGRLGPFEIVGGEGDEIELREPYDGAGGSHSIVIDRNPITRTGAKILRDMSDVLGRIGNFGELSERDQISSDLIPIGSERDAIKDALDVTKRAANLSDLTNLKEARSNLGTFSTVAEVQSRHIPAVLDSISVRGSRYEATSTEPSHEGKVRDAAGRWFELAEADITPQMLGAKGDGVTDDTQALVYADRVARALDRPLRGEGTYLISERTRLICPRIDMDRAVIKLCDNFPDSEGVVFDSLQKNVSAPIRLFVDGNKDNQTHPIIGALFRYTKTPFLEAHVRTSNCTTGVGITGVTEESSIEVAGEKCDTLVHVFEDVQLPESDTTPHCLRLSIFGSECRQWLKVTADDRGGMGFVADLHVEDSVDASRPGIEILSARGNYTLAGEMRGVQGKSVFVDMRSVGGGTEDGYDCHVIFDDLKTASYSETEPAVHIASASMVSGSLVTHVAHGGGLQMDDVSRGGNLLYTLYRLEGGVGLTLGKVGGGSVKSGNITYVAGRLASGADLLEVNNTPSNNHHITTVALASDGSGGGITINDPNVNLTGAHARDGVNWLGAQLLWIEEKSRERMVAVFRVNDDSVLELPWQTPRGRIFLQSRGSNLYLSGRYNSIDGSPGIPVQIFESTPAVTAASGVLDGTTGADGDLTVSGAAGSFYFENRTGSSQTFRLVLD